jgi:hypothetical protein
MKKNLILIIITLLSVSMVTAQDFKIVQVTLKNGQVYKGKKATLTAESVSFLSGSAQKTYPLNDVSLVQAREGKAGKWALAMGGGCLAVCIVVVAVNASQDTETTGTTDEVTYSTGTLIAGSIIWTGIFAGAGALIGNASDHWQNVFITKATSKLKNIDINFGPNRYAKYNVGFTYKF